MSAFVSRIQLKSVIAFTQIDENTVITSDYPDYFRKQLILYTILLKLTAYFLNYLEAFLTVFGYIKKKLII